MKAAFSAAGYSTHPPKDARKAKEQRAGRVEALRVCVREFSGAAQPARRAFADKWPDALLKHGADACCTCKRLGYGATHCRATGQGCSGHGPVAVWVSKAGELCWCEGPSVEYHFPVGCHVQCAKVSGTVAAFDEATGQHTVRLDSDGTFQTHYLAYYFKQCSPPLGSVTYPDGVQVCCCGKPSPEEAAKAAVEAAVAAEKAFSVLRSRKGGSVLAASAVEACLRSMTPRRRQGRPACQRRRARPQARAMSPPSRIRRFLRRRRL